MRIWSLIQVSERLAHRNGKPIRVPAHGPTEFSLDQGTGEDGDLTMHDRLAVKADLPAGIIVGIKLQRHRFVGKHAHFV